MTAQNRLGHVRMRWSLCQCQLLHKFSDMIHTDTFYICNGDFHWHLTQMCSFIEAKKLMREEQWNPDYFLILGDKSELLILLLRIWHDQILCDKSISQTKSITGPNSFLLWTRSFIYGYNLISYLNRRLYTVRLLCQKKWNMIFTVWCMWGANIKYCHLLHKYSSAHWNAYV